MAQPDTWVRWVSCALFDGAQHDCSARWVIATDGSRRPVRKVRGLKLGDLDFEEPWLVFDAEVEGATCGFNCMRLQFFLARASVIRMNREQPEDI